MSVKSVQIYPNAILGSHYTNNVKNKCVKMNLVNIKTDFFGVMSGLHTGGL